MAETKEMPIPLRAAWKVPRTNRAKRAMAEVKNHVAQHMKQADDEDIWIDEGLCKGHADIVAAPTARWVLALGRDIGVADWRPGFLNLLDLVVWDEVCEDGEAIDAKFHQVAVEVVGHGGSSYIKE